MFSRTVLIFSIFCGTSTVLVQGAAPAQSDLEVARIAKALSIKIETEPGADGRKHMGSGVIIQKQGDLYTVLTAAHVVRAGTVARITTAIDDQTHPVAANSIQRPTSNIDLAVFQFRSTQNYPVAKIGDSNLLESGMDIYVSGFPAPTSAITERVWVFREGKVTANSNRIFKDGYSLIYSNSTLPGMSGGAVLNRAGQLVAIHGKGDRSSDGHKTDYNLGVPINRFGDIAQEIKAPNAAEIPVTRTATTPKADDFLVAALNKNSINDSQGALADLGQAVALNPKFAQAYSIRGTLKYLKLNDSNGALADYNQAIAISPNYAIAYNNRGNLKENKLNDLNGALADYNQAISINPNYAIAYYNRGSLKHQRLNDPSGALSDYNQALLIDPLDAEAYLSRSTLKYLKLNDIHGSLADMNQAILVNDRYGEAFFNRGVLKKERLNDAEGAIRDFQQAAKLFRAQGRHGFLKAALRQLQALGAKE